MPAITDYDPDSYNRQSFANIMQFITADLMIQRDVRGPEAFVNVHRQVVEVRKKIREAYTWQDPGDGEMSPPAEIAEAVLLWLREGATVEDVLEAWPETLIERAREVVRK